MPVEAAGGHQVPEPSRAPPSFHPSAREITRFVSSCAQPSGGKRQRRVRMMMSTVDAGAAGAGSPNGPGARAGPRATGSVRGDGSDPAKPVDGIGGEPQPDFYGALGLKEGASPAEIKVRKIRSVCVLGFR